MTSIGLRDPTLLLRRLYVGGEWREANAGAELAVVDPANGASWDRPRCQGRGRRAGDRSHGRRNCGLAFTDGRAARRDARMVIPAHRGQQG